MSISDAELARRLYLEWEADPANDAKTSFRSVVPLARKLLANPLTDKERGVVRAAWAYVMAFRSPRSKACHSEFGRLCRSVDALGAASPGPEAELLALADTLERGYSPADSAERIRAALARLQEARS